MAIHRHIHLGGRSTFTIGQRPCRGGGGGPLPFVARGAVSGDYGGDIICQQLVVRSGAPTTSALGANERVRPGQHMGASNAAENHWGGMSIPAGFGLGTLSAGCRRLPASSNCEAGRGHPGNQPLPGARVVGDPVRWFGLLPRVACTRSEGATASGCRRALVVVNLRGRGVERVTGPETSR